VTVTLTRNTMNSLLTGDIVANKTASESVDPDDQVEEEKENKDSSDAQSQSTQVS